MDDTTLAYVAGLIDGEGYIGISYAAQKAPYCTPRYRLRISVGMTCEHIVRWLADTFGFNVYVKQPDFRNRRQTVYTADLQAIRCADFLRAIRPWLKIKDLQADVAIDFQESCSAWKLINHHGERLPDAEVMRRHQLYLRLQELNGHYRGTKSTSS
jgi:hypothetical protein